MLDDKDASTGLHPVLDATAALTSAVRDWFRRPLKAGLPNYPILRAPPERMLRASRILLFPGKIFQLWLLRFLRAYLGHREHPDWFFYLVHNHYLSKKLSLRQRITCAVSHYGHESRSCGDAYHRAVYRSAEGLTLWRRDVKGIRYTLCLRASETYRHEGDLSILCMVDDVRVCRLAFTYVRGALFGLDAPTTMFVTRNQTDRNAALQQFRTDFKQNSPPYFCLAALFGIAMAHGMRNIFMIREEAQIAYDPRFAASFRNSYSDFWRAFGAKELDEYDAFTMPVPPELNSIATVKHKARAASRRQNWLDIMVKARQTILQDRLTGSPLPIDVETSALVRSSALRPRPARAHRNESETADLEL